MTTKRIGIRGFVAVARAARIHLCESAYYPHRLRLLGRSQGFGFTQRVTQVGPITVGDITTQRRCTRFRRESSSTRSLFP